ncbi:hypothetical protein NSERUTF1_2567 [Nocardia seriolae]|nr:hypothetical protein NSERUTF1_2567 [Nocardia seriolae]
MEVPSDARGRGRDLRFRRTPRDQGDDRQDSQQDRPQRTHDPQPTHPTRGNDPIPNRTLEITTGPMPITVPARSLPGATHPSYRVRGEQ